ncbi:hypothetical protein FB451DRAFT_1241897 [Mycena latifolia]|nr:hypothetical protein FB451DRAFT_1241897 [Mycena latifolia]
MDPLLASLSQSNEPLNDSQALHVRLNLEATLTALADIDAEIFKVSLHLAKLEMERHRRSEYATALKRVLSPIHRFPFEILAAIFVLCRDDSLQALKYSVLDARQAPMMLSHVSSRWRHICHEVPALWDHICLPTNARILDSTIHLLKPILTRSHALPLHVELKAWDAASSMEPLFDLLFQHHQRLKHIRFELKSFDLSPRILNGRCSLPILSSVQLIMPQKVDFTHAMALFGDAPQLRDVYLKCTSLVTLSLASSLPLSWSRLTRVEFDTRLSFHEARAILAQCDMVQDCRFNYLIDFDDLVPPEDVYQLVHLQRFTIRTHDEAPPAFFGSFSFPNLRYLRISALDFSPDILPDLHDRSKFRLTDLSLHYVYLGALDLLRFLRDLPSLQTLDLEYCCIEEALFKAFTYNPETFDPASPIRSFTLPELRSLTIASQESDVDGTVIADMAESVRAHAGGSNVAFPALDAVHLRLDVRFFDDEVEDRLMAACRTGIVQDHSTRFDPAPRY